MATRRRIDRESGSSAVAAWLAAPDDADGETVATAARFAAEELAAVAPGRSVELRVPPYVAVQCVDGGVHTRGTPRAVVETDATTWLAVATGELTWAEAVDSGKLTAAGQRSDLSPHLPLWSPPHLK